MRPRDSGRESQPNSSLPDHSTKDGREISNESKQLACERTVAKTGVCVRFSLRSQRRASQQLETLRHKLAPCRDSSSSRSLGPKPPLCPKRGSRSFPWDEQDLALHHLPKRLSRDIRARNGE